MPLAGVQIAFCFPTMVVPRARVMEHPAHQRSPAAGASEATHGGLGELLDSACAGGRREHDHHNDI